MNVLITGGAGYIGSLLTGLLLYNGHTVTVVDDLLFGGESLLAYRALPNFHFVKGDVWEPAVIEQGFKAAGSKPDAIVHLAAIVGFPACQQVGEKVAWRYNVETTQRVFGHADALEVPRFIFSSTYSNYGLAEDGQPVDESSPLNPQSLYAETKIASEEYLLGEARSSRCAPILYRFATLFGVSPRTRFDLIINQFVLEALTTRKLIIYQRGYARSFVHVRDVVRALIIALETDIGRVRGQIFNVGADRLNYTKDEIVGLIQQEVPGTVIEHKDLSFGGDMRDIRVSFRKIRETLGFEPEFDVIDGVREVRDALTMGFIKNPTDARYRNAQFIVQ